MRPTPASEPQVGRLYVVATPIGNLSDLSRRAEEQLKTADLIVAEDTRVTKKLLDHYGIRTSLQSVHHHTTGQELQRIVAELKDGKQIALVTDAGTPGVSDPGGALVAAAHKAGVPVFSVPGPSALTAALSVSGLPTDRFRFLGFVPHKKGRETMFREIGASHETVAFFESPHRIMKTLESLKEALTPDRLVVVCRELTKLYEEVVRGSATYIYEVFTDNPGKIRGEFVVIVSPGLE